MGNEEIPYKRGNTCPVCGQPIDWIEKRVVNGHVYYYAWHIVNENGQKRRKKCYLGAHKYDYVSRKNSDLGIALRGMAFNRAERLTEYINSATDKLSAEIGSSTLELEQAKRWLSAIRDAAERLQSFAVILEDYIKELEAEERAEG